MVLGPCVVHVCSSSSSSIQSSFYEQSNYSAMEWSMSTCRWSNNERGSWTNKPIIINTSSFISCTPINYYLCACVCFRFGVCVCVCGSESVYMCICAYVWGIGTIILSFLPCFNFMQEEWLECKTGEWVAEKLVLDSVSRDPIIYLLKSCNTISFIFIPSALWNQDRRLWRWFWTTSHYRCWHYFPLRDKESPWSWRQFWFANTPQLPTDKISVIHRPQHCCCCTCGAPDSAAKSRLSTYRVKV